MFLIEKLESGTWIPESKNHKGYSTRKEAERIGLMLYGTTFNKGYFRVREV
jgi:hypothetical protein